MGPHEDQEHLLNTIRMIVRDELRPLRKDVRDLREWRNQWRGAAFVGRIASQLLISVGTVVAALWWIHPST